MEILTTLNIPLIDKQKIPVALLVRQLEATGSDKRLLEKHIKEMNLVSMLDESSIQIRSFANEEYLYNVIYVIEVYLKDDSQHKELSRLLHSAFPESVMLIFKYNDKVYLNCALKRINKNDQSKMVIEDVFETQVNLVNLYEHLDLSKIKAINIKEYYETIITLINQITVFNIIGVFPSSNINYKKIIKNYEKIQTEIVQLQNEYSKETMLAKKMKIDMKLFDKEQELEKLKKEIRIK